jgi:ATP-dependent RNA helicase DeaD
MENNTLSTNPERDAVTQELPDFRFEDLSEKLQERVKELGWDTPMEVQAKAIPMVRRGRDVIIQSHTGSGKTGAFLLPLIMGVNPDLKATQALILAPTREIAIQIFHEFELLTADTPLNGALLYGGVGYGNQLKALEGGAQIVIGTPGRVLDHFDRGTLKGEKLTQLVLDEADEMLSMGFYPAMRKVRRFLPKRRQGMMFSATMPRSVLNLSKEFLYEPEFLTLSGNHVGVETLSHEYFIVEPMDKDRALIRLIEMENPANALIFCNRKSDVEYLYQFMQNAGYDVDRISGDLSQRAREEVMRAVRDRTVRFLIATDVAARGIDIKDLDIVFQYDVPSDHEVYVHRAGRTARAGKSGRCIALSTFMDEFQLKQIQSRFKLALEKKVLPDLEKVAERVSERTTVLLEEEMRDAGSIQNERIDRFVNLADQLTSSDEGHRIFAMLLDEYYHRSLHLPTALPEEKTRYEDIADKPRKKSTRSNQGGRDGSSRGDGPRGDAPRGEKPRGGKAPQGSRPKRDAKKAAPQEPTVPPKTSEPS